MVIMMRLLFVSLIAISLAYPKPQKTPVKSRKSETCILKSESHEIHRLIDTCFDLQDDKIFDSSRAIEPDILESSGDQEESPNTKELEVYQDQNTQGDEGNTEMESQIPLSQDTSSHQTSNENQEDFSGKHVETENEPTSMEQQNEELGNNESTLEASGTEELATDHSLPTEEIGNTENLKDTMDSEIQENLGNTEESENAENSERMEESGDDENLEKTKELEIEENLESIEETKIEENVYGSEKQENLENTEDLEKQEDLGKAEDLEKEDILENTEDLEKQEDLEKAEDLEKQEILEKAEDLEKQENLEKEKVLENTESLEKEEILENTEKSENKENLEKIESTENLEATEELEYNKKSAEEISESIPDTTDPTQNTEEQSNSDTAKKDLEEDKKDPKDQHKQPKSSDTSKKTEDKIPTDQLPHAPKELEMNVTNIIENSKELFIQFPLNVEQYLSSLYRSIRDEPIVAFISFYSLLLLLMMKMLICPLFSLCKRPAKLPKQQFTNVQKAYEQYIQTVSSSLTTPRTQQSPNMDQYLQRAHKNLKDYKSMMFGFQKSALDSHKKIKSEIQSIK